MLALLESTETFGDVPATFDRSLCAMRITIKIVIRVCMGGGLFTTIKENPAPSTEPGTVDIVGY